ncbi:MAG: efflux RND transporter periplasmic adaptor subunit [bacterium]
MSINRPVAGVVAVAVVLVLLGVWGFGGQESAAPLGCIAVRDSFLVATVTRGEVDAVNSVPVPAPQGWNNKVTELIPEGTSVSPGDVLARFDTDQQSQRVEEERSAFEQAQAELENQRASNAKTLAQKEAALQRMELALERAALQGEAMKFESESRRRQQELERRRAELDLEEARKDLAAQREIGKASEAEKEARLRKAKIDLERAEDALASLTVTAPDSGLVVHQKIWASGERRKIRVGDQVWNGQSIMELPDLSAFRVDTWVNEVDVHQLEKDQDVEVTIEALKNRRLAGKVTRIAPLARQEGEKKLKVFDVEVTLDGSVEGLLPGMTAQCRIIHRRLEDAVQVPHEAVFQVDGRSVVYTLDGQELAVTLGPAGADRVVIETGVEEGRQLRLSSPAGTAGSKP